MSGFTDFLKTQPPGRIAAIGGSLIVMMVFFAYIMLRATKPDMSLLFAQIDSADGGRIIEKLKAMHIPNEIRGDGTQIYVPTDDVAHLRMELANEGLPSGGSVGYEIFDKGDVLGTTSTMMDLNYLRALEGEISKSIRTIQGVQSARVHLVMPKRELFSQNRQEPSASIVLKMKGNSRLSPTQAQSIQHLVSASVPGLILDKVSIIDDKGTMLARGKERAESANVYTAQDEIRRNAEERLARTIEGLLEKTLGNDKARAEVSADMDFDKVTQTSVEFNPDGSVARSTNTSQEGSDSNESNSIDAVSIQNALPDQSGAAGAGQNKAKGSRNEEQTTFEISNKTITQVKETGTVRRLSVAVLIDGTYKKGTDGKETYAPRTPEEIEQITTLVKTAVGFKEDRGDSVKVVNMPFSVPAPFDEAKEPGMFSKLNLNKIIELVLLGTFGLLIGIMVLKPVISAISDKIGTKKEEEEYDDAKDGKRKRPPGNTQYVMMPQSNAQQMPPNMSPDMMPGGTPATDYQFYNPDGDTKMYIPQSSGVNPYLQAMLNMNNIEDRVNDSTGKKIGEIIEKHPEEAIATLRNWLYGAR